MPMDVDAILREIIEAENAIVDVLDALESKIGRRVAWVKVDREGGGLCAEIATEKSIDQGASVDPRT